MTRNIVLIGSDSVRADHCSCYGYGRKTTPFLDGLAEGGVRFENPIVSGIATLNSFIGIFTGAYSPLETDPFHPERWKGILNQRKTLASVLSRKGYHTYGFNINPLLSRYYGFSKGFQHYYDGLWTEREKDKEEKDQGRETKKFYLTPASTRKGLGKQLSRLRQFLKADIGYPRTEEWIDEIFNTRLEEPYFLWVFLIDTHHPYVPPQEYDRWGKTGTRRRLWLDYKMRRFGRGEAPPRRNSWTMLRRGLQPKLSQKEHEAVVAGYDGEILHVDSIVKQLWEHLKDTNPALIFHSDHGDELGEHGFYGHHHRHYEGLIRVPLIVYNVGRKGVVEEPVSLLRLAPTIGKLAGIENEFESPGLFDDVPYSPPVVYNKLRNINEPRVTARDKEWKLITNPDREDELYHIKEDPLEKENLIGKERDVEKELRELIGHQRKLMGEREGLRKKIQTLKKLGKI